MYINFLSSFFMIAKNLKQPKCLQFVVDKHIAIYLYNGIIKRSKLLITCNNMGESQNHYAEWKKSETKATYHMIPFIWHFIKSNTVGTGTRSVAWELGELMTKECKKTFWGCGNVLKGLYRFVKTHYTWKGWIVMCVNYIPVNQF